MNKDTKEAIKIFSEFEQQLKHPSNITDVHDLIQGYMDEFEKRGVDMSKVDLNCWDMV